MDQGVRKGLKNEAKVLQKSSLQPTFAVLTNVTTMHMLKPYCSHLHVILHSVHEREAEQRLLGEGHQEKKGKARVRAEPRIKVSRLLAQSCHQKLLYYQCYTLHFTLYYPSLLWATG